MLRFAGRCHRTAAVLTAAIILTACGGGGAAPPSGPDRPTGPGIPPAAPSVPAQPTPPPPPPASPTSPPTTTAPSIATISTPGRTFAPSVVTIAVNGTVTWQAIDDDHDIRFTSAAPPGGSPGEVEEGTSVSRTFPAAGSYDFECLRHNDKGMRGKIVVEGTAATPTPPSTPTPPPPSGASATVTTPNETFSPSDVTIPTGGSVTWQFSGTRHNVTFTGTPPSGGNIPDQEPGTTASRTFAAPGTYTYLCTRHSGMTGRVLVQ
jgi:plastocyanin